MKKLSVILAVLVASLVVVTPVFAYSGVTGQIIDSKDSADWQYGGDVWVVNNTEGTIVATCLVSMAGGSEGKIVDGAGASCDYGDDALGGSGSDYTVSTTNTDSGDEMEVIINFACDYSGNGDGTGGNCGGPPEGVPGDSSSAYTESGIPITKNLGYIETGTGPNAITLANVTATSANVWLPVGLAAVALVALGAVVLVRKRR